MATTILFLSVTLLLSAYLTAAEYIDTIEHKHTIVNRTKLGNNLCNVCKTIIFQCNYNITVDCSYTNGLQNQTYYAGPRKRRSYLRRRHRHRGGKWNNHNNNYWTTRRPRSKNTTTVSPYTFPPPKKCVETVDKTCVKESCDLECCDGSLIDTRTQSCEHINFPIKCKNGGTVSKRKNDCLCPKGFVGKACQHRECTLVCQNGGACHTRTSNKTTNLAETSYNDDHCVCPSYTTGKFCETKTCRHQCFNNGTCSNYHWPYCMCTEGFYGRFCEKTRKTGNCPPLTKTTCRYNVFHFGFHCWRDESCPGEQRCCRDACGRRTCTNPYHDNSTCTYNNETIALGTAFFPDECRVCTCNASHAGSPHGVIECALIQCPETPKYCTNVTTPEGACCPICNDDPDAAMCGGNYTFPYFTNCPEKQVTIDVQEDSNLAMVNIGLVAKDCKRDMLNVTYYPDRLKAGRGEENYRLVSATTSRDNKGNFAECIFYVHIRDKFPPKFVTCPSDFSQPSPGAVTWDVPVATDNVGLAILPTSRRHPGDKVSPGDFMVEYWAEDYQGNMGKCSFVVSVGNDMSQGQGHSAQVGKKQYKVRVDRLEPLPSTHANMSISLGIASTVIVIALVAMAIFFYQRQRKLVRSHAAAAAATAAANSAASAATPAASMGSMAGLGDHWNSGGILPQYSLPPENMILPPSYSRTDEMLAAGGMVASGGQQEAGELPSKNSVAAGGMEASGGRQEAGELPSKKPVP